MPRLSEEELLELEQLLENTIWTNRIKNKIRELEQIETDESFSIYEIEKLKESKELLELELLTEEEYQEIKIELTPIIRNKQ